MAFLTGAVIAELKLKKDQFDAGIKSAKNSFKSLDDEAQASLTRLGSRLDKVGKTAAIGLAAGIGLAAKTAIDFEDDFAGVRKTVEATDKQLEEIKTQFVELSKTIPISANEFARIGELAGQLGVEADSITSFSETIAKMAVTTNLTSEAAATDFARIANVMQEPIENVDRMGSTVVELGNNFATTESEIVNFASRIAGAGNIAGLTTPDILSIGAAMSSVGVEAEAGGTATQKVLLAMNEAVVTNNDDLRIFANTAGLTLDEFKNLSPIEQFNEFVLGLGEAGDEAITVLDDLGMTDQRLMRSFLSLANAGDLVTEATTRGSKAFEENNAMQIEAEKRFETTAAQIQLAKNNFQALSLELGEALLPTLNDQIIPAVMAVTKFLTENQGVVKAGTVVLAGFAATWATVKTSMMIVDTIKGVSAAFQVLNGIITGAGGLSSALALLSGPLGLFLATAAAIVAVTIAARDLQDELAKLAPTSTTLTEQIDKLDEAIANAATDEEREKFVRLRDELVAQQTEVDTLRDKYEGFGGTIRAIIDNLPKAPISFIKGPGDASSIQGSFADGVQNFHGGTALVGERGPELVNLPAGADVIPNHQMGSTGGINVQNLNVTNGQSVESVVQSLTLMAQLT